MTDEITYSIVENQLNVLDKDIHDRSTAVFKARLYHVSRPECWHEIFRHGEDGTWGVFQLKPNDDPFGYPQKS